MSATKSLMDKEIMNVFEEQEDKFIFPITSQKDARDFVKLLNKHGCTYEFISKEVNEDEETFRDWRLGGGSQEIGKHVIDRINKPFRTMFSESESDDKVRQNSLNEFYQFSFEDEEVFTEASSKNPKIDVAHAATTKGTDSSNLPTDKSKSNLSPNRTSQTNISSAPKEIVTCQHQSPSTLAKPTGIEPAKRSPKTTPSSSPIATKKNIEVPTADKEKPRTLSPSRDKQVSQTTKQTPESPSNLKANKPIETVTKPVPEKTSNQNEIKPSTPKPPTTSAQNLSTHQISTPKQSPNTSASTPTLPSKPETPKQASTPTSPSKPETPKQASQTSNTPQATTTPATTKTNKEAAEATEEERPPSPVTTSPHYQPYAANFTIEDIEPMLNYNSDDQSEKDDGPGFIYLFSDIPSPTMKVSKHTKFRVKVGTSKNPLKRLQQALVFNPDIRMLASIPVKSRKSCKTALKENLKTMLMKNKVDWYWATLNSMFTAIDVALQKNN